MAWVAEKVAQYGLEGDVLEVGSYDQNGSVRSLFPGHYLGIDVRDGPGVDVAIPIDQVPTFCAVDVVVSTETLEHDPRPWQTVAHMARLLLPGGHLVLTCRGFGENGSYGYHPDPVDYWRPSIDAVRVLLEDAGLEILELVPDTDVTAPGVFAVAVKP